MVRISAGDMVPADLRLLVAKDLFLNQAPLTGESMPAEKRAEPPNPKGVSSVNHVLNRTAISAAARLAPLSEAARYAHCHEKTIRRRIADGSITAYRFGPRLIRIDLNEVDALLRRIPSAAS